MWCGRAQGFRKCAGIVAGAFALSVLSGCITTSGPQHSGASPAGFSASQGSVVTGEVGGYTAGEVDRVVNYLNGWMAVYPQQYLREIYPEAALFVANPFVLPDNVADVLHSSDTDGSSERYRDNLLFSYDFGVFANHLLSVEGAESGWFDAKYHLQNQYEELLSEIGANCTRLGNCSGEELSLINRLQTDMSLSRVAVPDNNLVFYQTSVSPTLNASQLYRTAPADANRIKQQLVDSAETYFKQLSLSKEEIDRALALLANVAVDVEAFDLSVATLSIERPWFDGEAVETMAADSDLNRKVEPMRVPVSFLALGPQDISISFYLDSKKILNASSKGAPGTLSAVGVFYREFQF